MSQLGWIDFSSEDRGKVKNILAMLAEPGTLDELGIGQVRDAFADMLFPGISTIQTRAKYFITVPRILREYQEFTLSKKQSFKSLEKYLSDHENEVAKILVNVHDENEIGIIGRTRIDTGGVDRRPSVVYWNGLRTFGIIKTNLSLAEFCRQLDVNERMNECVLSQHTEDSDDSDVLKNNLDVYLPDNQPGWMSDTKLRIQLTKPEAEFLKGKMSDARNVEYSVPAQLIKCHLLDQALEDYVKDGRQPIDVLTEILRTNPNVDEKCKNRIELANQFSLAMEGPHLRYNIVLATKAGYDQSAVKYEKEYEHWLSEVKKKKVFSTSCADDWLMLAKNDGRIIKDRTRSFIKKWCQAVQDGIGNEDLDQMVADQAISNKDDRSLLKKGISQDQWVGIRRLDFRWGSAKTLLKDIQEGLNAKA